MAAAAAGGAGTSDRSAKSQVVSLKSRSVSAPTVSSIRASRGDLVGTYTTRAGGLILPRSPSRVQGFIAAYRFQQTYETSDREVIPSG